MGLTSLLGMLLCAFVLYYACTYVYMLYILGKYFSLSTVVFFPASFGDPANKAVTKTLVTQVQTLNPEFQAAQIRGKLVILSYSCVSKSECKYMYGKGRSSSHAVE